MRYLITFACYGAHLHGDERGSVDRTHNTPGTRLANPSENRIEAMRNQMDQPPYSLDQPRRAVVVNAIRQICAERHWTLLAAHARTNHVHAVVESDDPPEKLMQSLKANASRNLNQMGIDKPDRKRWARHGSTRWLWKDKDVQEAIRYVIDEQGKPMEVYPAKQM